MAWEGCRFTPEREEFGARINLEYNTIQHNDYNVIKAEVAPRGKYNCGLLGIYLIQ